MFKKIVLCLTVLIYLYPTSIKAAEDTAYLLETLGVVTAVSEDCIFVQGEPLTDGAADELIIRIGDAPVFDLLTGYTADADSVTEGMHVRVTYGSALTQTSPPLVDAAALWLNYGTEGSAALKVTVSENIQYNDGCCDFVTSDGKYRVTLTPDTAITDADDQYIAPEDIQPGMTMFIWLDMVTASFPALAYPEQAALVRQPLPYDLAE